MKNRMNKLLALMTVLVLVVGAVAFAEKETPSEAYRLPDVTAPVEETPAEETPVEETPVEEAPAEEAPAEETPAEETPAEETPAEETPAEESSVAGSEATVTLSDADARLNIRVAADAESECITSIPNGTVVTVLAEEGEWLRIVTADGTEGYAKASFLTVGAAEEPAAAEIDVSALRVEIFSTQGDVVAPGETIVLTSRLTGFEGLDYSVQWQCNDGSGWRDVEGATGETYSFTADAESINLLWRLAVSL